MSRIGPLFSSKKERDDFFHKINHPSKEEIKKHNLILDRLEKDITITRTKDGFVAEIHGLVL